MRLENDTGRLLTVLLVTAALVGATWIFFNIPVANTSDVDSDVNNKTTTERLVNCTCTCKDKL